MTQLQHNQDAVLLDDQALSANFGGYTHFK
jgi:hypothetical protein